MPNSISPARTPTPELIQVSCAPPTTPSTASTISPAMETIIQPDVTDPYGVVHTTGLKDFTNIRASPEEVFVRTKDTLQTYIPGSDSPSFARECDPIRPDFPSTDPTSDSVSQSQPSARDIILADPPAAALDASFSSPSYSSVYSSSYCSVGTSKHVCSTMAHAFTTTTTTSSIIPTTTHTTTTASTPLMPSRNHYHTPHTVAAAFTLPPQASTPLSEGSSHQQPIQPTERHHPPDPRVTFPVGPPIPETSTPIHELYPEPVKFVPESPISEPDDPDPLVNPYYYYAHAALAHWHERAQRTQEQVPEGDGNNSDQENSTSSSSASSTASRRFLQLRSFGNSSEVQGRTVTENKLDTPPSDVPLMDTPPSDVPPMDDSPEDEPKPSEVPVVEIEPLTKEIHKVDNLQTEPAAVPPLPIITKCTDHLENVPHPTRLMLDDFPLDLPLDDPPVGAYTYDWRTDPHLYQGWWCVEGSVSEHLAAQVPTQPVSPYDSPADTPTPNTPTTDQVRLPISILPTHAYAPDPPSFLHPEWALKVIGHSMKLTCDVAQRDTISVHNITIP